MERYSDQNSYTLDGGNNSDDMGGNITGYVTNFTGLGGTQTNGNPSGVMPTPVESIEEIKVNSFNQTADFNASIGGQVVMATKRGTNQFHGSGYGYYFDTALGAANTWTNDHTPSIALGLPYTPIVSNHRTRYGFSIGGPDDDQEVPRRQNIFLLQPGRSALPELRQLRTPDSDACVPGRRHPSPELAGVYVPYNLESQFRNGSGEQLVNPAMQTCSRRSARVARCDPRGIGLNPIVNQIWSKYMPLPNDPIYCAPAPTSTTRRDFSRPSALH